MGSCGRKRDEHGRWACALGGGAGGCGGSECRREAPQGAAARQAEGKGGERVHLQGDARGEALDGAPAAAHQDRVVPASFCFRGSAQPAAARQLVTAEAGPETRSWADSGSAERQRKGERWKRGGSRRAHMDRRSSGRHAATLHTACSCTPAESAPRNRPGSNSASPASNRSSPTSIVRPAVEGLGGRNGDATHAGDRRAAHDRQMSHY